MKSKILTVVTALTWGWFGVYSYDLVWRIDRCEKRIQHTYEICALDSSDGVWCVDRDTTLAECEIPLKDTPSRKISKK